MAVLNDPAFYIAAIAFIIVILVFIILARKD